MKNATCKHSCLTALLRDESFARLDSLGVNVSSMRKSLKTTDYKTALYRELHRICLRNQYQELTGKRAFNGWDIETLQQKIKELQDG